MIGPPGSARRLWKIPTPSMEGVRLEPHPGEEAARRRPTVVGARAFAGRCSESRVRTTPVCCLCGEVLPALFELTGMIAPPSSVALYRCAARTQVFCPEPFAVPLVFGVHLRHEPRVEVAVANLLVRFEREEHGVRSQA